jgi:hypothetical protein
MFAHADIDHIRVAFRNRHRADRTGLEITIRNVSPADAHVISLPQTATSGSHVVGLWVADHATRSD